MKVLLLTVHFFVFFAALFAQDASANQERVVLITGASQGVGQAIALQLERTGGYTIYAGMRKPNDLFSACKNVKPVRLDVTDPNNCFEVVREILNREGRLDVLINNAGQGLCGSLETLELAQAKQLFDVNLFGPFNMIQAVLPSMRSHQKGLIINISSIVGLIPYPCWDLYVASKFALEGLSRSLAPTLAHWNIDVVLIEPGLIATDFVENTPLGLRQIDGNPYATLTNAILQMVRGYPRPGQPPAEIALLVQKVIETDHPDMRYQTSARVQQSIATEVIDPSGNKSRAEDQQWLKNLW